MCIVYGLFINPAVHDVKLTSYQRRCVDLMPCACWVGVDHDRPPWLKKQTIVPFKEVGSLIYGQRSQQQLTSYADKIPSEGRENPSLALLTSGRRFDPGLLQNNEKTTSYSVEPSGAPGTSNKPLVLVNCLAKACSRKVSKIKKVHIVSQGTNYEIHLKFLRWPCPYFGLIACNHIIEVSAQNSVSRTYKY